MSAKIIGTGSALPEQLVSNDFLSTVVETNDEWIRTRTGICERRIATKETTTGLAATASNNALLDAGLSPQDIDMILVATMTPDHQMPSTSCEVQQAIGAVNAVCYDVNAACSGFLFAFNTAVAFIKAGLMTNVLVIGAEVLSKIVDWTDRSTCVLFGDGAGAVVVTADGNRQIDMVMGSDGSKGNVLTCGSRSMNNLFVPDEQAFEFMKMDGGEVFKFAVSKVPQCINQLLEQSNTSIDEIKYFVLHQANERILASVAKRLKVCKDRFTMNLDRCGNTSSASIPILLDDMNRKGLLKEGDKLILSGFGGGLTWGATLLEW